MEWIRQRDAIALLGLPAWKARRLLTRCRKYRSAHAVLYKRRAVLRLRQELIGNNADTPSPRSRPARKRGSR